MFLLYMLYYYIMVSLFKLVCKIILQLCHTQKIHTYKYVQVSFFHRNNAAAFYATALIQNQTKIKFYVWDNHIFMLSHQGIYSLWIKSQFFLCLVNGLSKQKKIFSTWKSSYNESGNHFERNIFGKAETIMQIAWILLRPLNTSYTYNGVDDDIPTKDLLLFFHIFLGTFPFFFFFFSFHFHFHFLLLLLKLL